MTVLPQWRLSVKVQLLGVQGLRQHQGCRDTNCLSHRSNGPNRIFFLAFGNLWSEGLFGQSLSVDLLIQEFKWPPWVGSFSFVRHIRHLKGPPDGVLLCCSAVHLSLKGQPLYCSAASAIVWGDGGYSDGSTVSPCLHDCLVFLHRHFPPQSPPSHPLGPLSAL